MSPKNLLCATDIRRKYDIPVRSWYNMVDDGRVPDPEFSIRRGKETIKLWTETQAEEIQSLRGKRGHSLNEK